MSFSFGNLFKDIQSMAHTFLGYVGQSLGIIGKYEPQIADALSHSMNYIEPLAVDIVAAEFGGPAGALVDVGVKNLLVSATALKSLIYDWQNSPGILAKLRALAADAASLIALGHIKNQDDHRQGEPDRYRSDCRRRSVGEGTRPARPCRQRAATGCAAGVESGLRGRDNLCTIGASRFAMANTSAQNTAITGENPWGEGV